LSTQAITQVFFQKQAAGVKDAIANKKSLVHTSNHPGFFSKAGSRRQRRDRNQEEPHPQRRESGVLTLKG
jgi:hypothetical protein